MSFFDTFYPITDIYGVYDLQWGKREKKTRATPRYFHALSFRISGRAHLQGKDFSLEVKQNELLFVPKKTGYTIKSEQDERLIVVHFASPLPPLSPEVFSHAAPLGRDFEKVLDVWSKKEKGYKQHSCGILYDILSKTAAGEEKDDPLLPALRFLGSHFTENDFDIGFLAGLCSISPTYFRRLFVRRFGLSPIEYIHNLRLGLAAELLDSQYYSVADVAEKCGIPNPKYFSLLFKRKTGLSPAAYRNRKG